MDAGYVSAKRILHSREAHGIDLIGLVHIDPSWQARTPGALDLSQFTVDWKHKSITCPQGQHSVGWQPAKDAKGESVVQVLFAKSVCQRCPVRSMCTDARATGRSMTLRFPQERHELLLAARQRQQTEAFKALYRRAQESRARSRRPRAKPVCAPYRSAQDASPAHTHRGCNQSPPPGCLAAGRALRQDTYFAICCSRRLIASSPTVSNPG